MKPFANNLTPFYPTHPGELLKEEIEFRKLSQRKLASQMGVSYSVLNEILNSKRPVNAEFALRIEAALGIEAEIIINLQSKYNLQIARTNKTFMQKLNEIREASTFAFSSFFH
ncbi:MAG: HigA family addiction module antidote protein [Paludibacter sp.]|nr:HigA family addiction module antidote protein [Paludibacter sp.]